MAHPRGKPQIFCTWGACLYHQIIIIIIAIERCNSCFITISSLCHKLSPTRTLKWLGRNHVQITWNAWGTHHMQHAKRHGVRRDSSDIKFDRDEIAFILALFYCLKPITDEGGEETRAPGENSWWRAPENATYLTHFVPQTRLSRFWRVVASARRRETFVRDRYLHFCVPSVEGECPS